MKRLLLILFTVLSLKAEEIKLGESKAVTVNDRPYCQTLVNFKDLDGYYIVYLHLSPDFKKWEKVFLCYVDVVGDAEFFLISPRNQWQKWDKSYSPCFLTLSLEKIGQSSDRTATK